MRFSKHTLACPCRAEGGLAQDRLALLALDEAALVEGEHELLLDHGDAAAVLLGVQLRILNKNFLCLFQHGPLGLALLPPLLLALVLVTLAGVALAHVPAKFVRGAEDLAAEGAGEHLGDGGGDALGGHVRHVLPLDLGGWLASPGLGFESGRLLLGGPLRLA